LLTPPTSPAAADPPTASFIAHTPTRSTSPKTAWLASYHH
jgi:hypothetical protein